MTYAHHCGKCGQDFVARVEVPNRCSRCGSKNWHTEGDGKHTPSRYGVHDAGVGVTRSTTAVMVPGSRTARSDKATRKK